LALSKIAPGDFVAAFGRPVRQRGFRMVLISIAYSHQNGGRPVPHTACQKLGFSTGCWPDPINPSKIEGLRVAGSYDAGFLYHPD